MWICQQVLATVHQDFLFFYDFVSKSVQNIKNLNLSSWPSTQNMGMPVEFGLKSAQKFGIFWKPYVSGVILKWGVLFCISLQSIFFLLCYLISKHSQFQNWDCLSEVVGSGSICTKSALQQHSPLWKKYHHSAKSIIQHPRWLFQSIFVACSVELCRSQIWHIYFPIPPPHKGNILAREQAIVTNKVAL